VVVVVTVLTLVQTVVAGRHHFRNAQPEVQGE
jgi:hypothetical protein